MLLNLVVTAEVFKVKSEEVTVVELSNSASHALEYA